MTFLAATYGDKYRKPGTEMWTYFCKNLNGGQLIDIDLSFYCGDAAGRPKTESRPKDFSDSDRKYAVNIGLTFMTPELLFLGIKETLPKLEDNKAKLNQAKSMIKDSKPGEEVKIASDK
jgi:bifunctional polynucleotide phosphatase/kinase